MCVQELVTQESRWKLFQKAAHKLPTPSSCRQKIDCTPDDVITSHACPRQQRTSTHQAHSIYGRRKPTAPNPLDSRWTDGNHYEAFYTFNLRRMIAGAFNNIPHRHPHGKEECTNCTFHHQYTDVTLTLSPCVQSGRPHTQPSPPGIGVILHWYRGIVFLSFLLREREYSKCRPYLLQERI